MITMTEAKTPLFYKINLWYNNGNYSINQIQVSPYLQNQIEKNIGGYSAEILALNGTILNVSYFNIPLLIYWDSLDNKSGEITSGGVTELNKTEVTLFLPYYENAKEINIYDVNLAKILSIDVSDFSKNNQIKIEEEINEPIKIQPIQKNQVIERKKYKIYLVYIILAFLSILALIFLIKKIKNKII